LVGWSINAGHIFTYGYGFVICYVYYQVRDHGSVLGQVALPPKKYTTALPSHLERKRRKEHSLEYARAMATAKVKAAEAARQAKLEKARKKGTAKGEGGLFAAVSGEPKTSNAHVHLRRSMTQPDMNLHWTSSNQLPGSITIHKRRRSLPALHKSNAVVPHNDDHLDTDINTSTSGAAKHPSSSSGNGNSSSSNSRDREVTIKRLLESGANIKRTNVRRLPKLDKSASSLSSAKLRTAFSSTNTLGSMQSLKLIHVADTPRGKLNNGRTEASKRDLNFDEGGAVARSLTNKTYHLGRQESHDSIFGNMFLHKEDEDDGNLTSRTKPGHTGRSIDSATKPGAYADDGTKASRRVPEDNKEGVINDDSKYDVLTTLTVPPGFIDDDDDDEDDDDDDGNDIFA
jgi:hypothetical protein